VFLLPLAVVGLVVAHILLVRKHGIVPPFHVPQGHGQQPLTHNGNREPAPAQTQAPS
jgi:quinol-cytochrome oxidoreductase complex cytochrome b subunit